MRRGCPMVKLDRTRGARVAPASQRCSRTALSVAVHIAKLIIRTIDGFDGPYALAFKMLKNTEKRVKKLSKTGVKLSL